MQHRCMPTISTLTRRVPRVRAAPFTLALVLLLAPVDALIVDATKLAAGTLDTLAPQARVFIVGTLYRRHETVPAYDLATIRRIVLAVDPQVLVVDCTPQEVRDRTVHASKIEYAQVVFPLMQERQYKVYPAEPDEPLFTEIVQAGAGALQTFQRTKPQESAALQDYVKATYAALSVHWQSPADVQDTLTGHLLAAKVALHGRLTGTADLSTRWNQHWTDTILKAAAENPGARVLALTGIENRAWIVDALQRSGQVDLVDMPSWLKSTLR